MKLTRMVNNTKEKLTAYKIPLENPNTPIEIEPGSYVDIGEYSIVNNMFYLSMIKRGFTMSIVDSNSIDKDDHVKEESSETEDKPKQRRGRRAAVKETKLEPPSKEDSSKPKSEDGDKVE